MISSEVDLFLFRLMFVTGSMTRTSEYACDESQFQSNQHNSHLLLVTTDSGKSNSLLKLSKHLCNL